MKVSLVIPTYNRPQKLKETLEAVALQTNLPDEIIVVDDGSDAGSAEINSRICRDHPKCKLVVQRNAGASAALNNGIRNSSGELIVILDDDIIPEPAAIAKHIGFHKTKGPAVLSGDAHTDPARVTSDVERYKIHMEEEWLRKRPDTQQAVKVNFDNFIVTTANTSFTRGIFDRIGGFEESLRDGYDVDFGIRALILDVPVWFDRSIRAIHNDRITLRYYAKRQSLYDTSKKTILAKHPELKKLLHFTESPKKSGVRKIAYSILRKKNIVNFIEGSRLMMLLPKKLRYRIYGSTIAALCGNL